MRVPRVAKAQPWLELANAFSVGIDLMTLKPGLIHSLSAGTVSRAKMGEVPLLLVVYRPVADLLALGSGSGCGHGASSAVGRNGYSTG